ncbi:hypothetical protein B7486_19215 [cyanobacterium TDX16]|nr:hypothetical protein B7486_19215 [cyanobacterium TDX16]
MNKCSIQGCPGDYELKSIAHTVRHKGQLVVIDGVPAEICSVCGDSLLSPETVRHIEQILASVDAPSGNVPLYEYAS